MFKRSQGTSEIHGHLYETKLLSLILYRALHDNNIEEFYLASNIADIGVFDDICFKAKTNDGKPLVVFTQAKHSKNSISTLNKKSNIVKYFNSYTKIKSKFDPTCGDHIFNAKYNETDCLFVVYTIAEGKKNLINTANPSVLNNLIATGQVGSQRLYGGQNVQFIAKIITAAKLAESFAKFLYLKHESQSIEFRENEILIRFHVILSKEVVDVTEIVNENQRKCKFRNDFFNTTDPFLTMLRDDFYLEILKNQKSLETLKNQKLYQAAQQDLLLIFLAQPSENTLIPVIGRSIIYEDNNFEFVQKHTSLSLREELRQIKLPQSTVKSAIKQAALSILQSPDMFKVPSTFGNIDLKENNINNLTNIIRKYLNDSVTKKTSEDGIIKVVTINETETSEIWALNRNLGSTIGNILISDDENSFFKFVETDSSLNPNAKIVLSNFEDENLKEYRFDVKNLQFPKLTYNHVDEGLTIDFLSKLILYTEQASQIGVEEILKDLIQIEQINATQNYRIKSDAIFLKYHDKIQNWWMSSGQTPYLTKACNIYQQTVDDIVNNRVMSIAYMTYMNKINNFNCKFSDVAISSLSSSLDIFTKPKSIESSTLFIVTDSARLTVTKIKTYLKISYVVLDFNYILEMLPDDYQALISEINNTNKEDNKTGTDRKNKEEDTFILVCDLDNFAISRDSYRIHDKFKKMVAVLNAKKKMPKIVIVNENISETISKYFVGINKTQCFEKHSLIDFEPQSRQNILENCHVIFQGLVLNLNWLVDEKSMAFIKGEVLNEIIFSKRIVIGDLLTDTNYENIKHLYIDRRLSRNETLIELQTLHNVKGDIVLLTGKPGMGKSTLLTHLSLETKKRNMRLWIVKINLLDHSEELKQLQRNQKSIDSLKTLKFMCLALLKIKKQLRESSLDLKNLEITLRKADGEIYLDEFFGDQWSKFELKMFLHLYNKGNVVFLFDGFDEICPYYKDTVITLIHVLRKDTQEKKIDWSKSLPWPQVWITSRAYNELKSLLHNHYSVSYELDNFSLSQLHTYLDKFWRSNLIFSKFNKKLITRIQLFLDNTSTEKIINNFTLSRSLGRVQGSFLCYLITNSPEIDGMKRWHHLYRTIKFLQQCVPNISDTACNNHDVECPLLTCLAANYFVDYLKRPDENNPMESFNIDASSVYKWLIEAVIQRYYKDKKKSDLDNVYNMMDYESKLPIYMEQHKKIAAYAVFRNDIKNIFDEIQLSKIEVLINSIKKGEEVTGLTCSVLNNIPQFVQMTFAQYLAVEFLFELLQSKDMIGCKRRKILTTVLFNQIDSFCIWLNHKLELLETGKYNFFLYCLGKNDIDFEIVSRI